MQLLVKMIAKEQMETQIYIQDWTVTAWKLYVCVCVCYLLSQSKGTAKLLSFTIARPHLHPCVYDLRDKKQSVMNHVHIKTPHWNKQKKRDRLFKFQSVTNYVSCSFPGDAIVITLNSLPPGNDCTRHRHTAQPVSGVPAGVGATVSVICIVKTLPHTCCSFYKGTKVNLMRLLRSRWSARLQSSGLETGRQPLGNWLTSGCWRLQRCWRTKNLIIALITSRLLLSPVVCMEDANLYANTHVLLSEVTWNLNKTGNRKCCQCLGLFHQGAISAQVFLWCCLHVRIILVWAEHYWRCLL